MKAEIELADLARVVNAVKGMSRRTALPILHCLTIEATDKGVTLARFDYETAVSVTLPGAMSDGRVAVSATAFADALKALSPKGKAAKAARVQLVADERTLRMCVNHGPEVTLSLESVEDYPALPGIGTHHVTALHGGEMHEVIRSVLPAAGKDQTVPVLTHVEVSRITARGVTFAHATDRYRMHRLDMGASEAGDETFRVMVPAGVLKLWGALTKGMDPFQYGFLTHNGEPNGDARRYSLSTAYLATTITVTWRDYVGDFPKLEKILDSARESAGYSEAHVNVARLLDAVKAASAMLGKASPVVLTVDGDDLRVTAFGDVDGAHTPVFATTVQGADVERIPDGNYGYTPAYLVELLTSAPADVVTLRVTPNKPAIFEAGTWTGLIMPIRIGS